MDQSMYREMEERRSIRDNSRNLKKYGSTSKRVIRNENLIKHIICKTDTLPGIALKYGTTTEQIRRINRLWASDSLFLRESLLVPAPVQINSASTSSSCSNNDGIAECNESDYCQDPSANTVSSDEDSSINNFLARMDSSIASVKKDIQKTQGNSAFSPEEELLFVQRRSGSRLRHSHPQPSPMHSSFSTASSSSSHLSSAAGPARSSSEDNVNDLPSAVVMTQGKKLKSSLQKLQQQQDEIFQL
ncbi:lysM and putative peptidoglycan-binding domain-containing protein 2 [Microplitis mediator]|uniref:lysM and putative peptidoglycan-binding domain-containing protein 2 n=1 Tax=Microplitis mediator TaxID=375433 RepID=UPI00255268F5|nr:lysM and putative peptidoglycan-binding domain-containing protein 2 [Microplitis mediator]